MADRIEPYRVPVPAGTAKATPQVTALAFNPGIVRHITVTVPPGPSGFVGFNFLHMGGPVIPYQRNEFVVADDRVVEWDVSNMPTNTGWQLQAYNTDVFIHTLYIEFQIDEIPLAPTGQIPLISLGV